MNTDCPQPVLPEQEFLTVKQTAQFLNISASIVYRLCITKKLAHYRFGEGAGAIRISRAELLEFIKRCHVEERDEGVRVVVPPRRATEYVFFKHLDFRPTHPCGAVTKAGKPCPNLSTGERCHLHRKKPDSSH